MSAVRNRPLMVLAGGHFTVDMYSGILPVMYPLLIGRFDLDLKTVGLVSLAYSGSASVSQPFFGWLADRYGTRLTGITLAWTGVLFACIGFAPSFPILLIIAAFAGLGSGAFHPMGAVTANRVIPEGRKNTAMSIYGTGGTFGIATGPLVGALLFNLLGVRATGFLLLPGISIAVWVLWSMRAVGYQDRTPLSSRSPAAAVPVGLLAIIVAVMMLRSFPVFGLQNFVPIWYQELGYGAGFYGPLATVIVLGSAFGAVIAGNLADAYGRRAVILGTQVLTIPAIWAFAEFPGRWGFVTGALVGLLAASTAPLLLVMAQQLMRGRAGVASGLILGLGFIAGAIGTPVFGALADAFGMQNAVRWQLVVVTGTIFIAWLLPSEARIRSQTHRDERAEPAASRSRTIAAAPEQAN